MLILEFGWQKYMEIVINSMEIYKSTETVQYIATKHFQDYRYVALTGSYS